jgi:hypothetical protein
VDTLYFIAFLIFALIVPVHLYCVSALYKVINLEKPEWLKYEGGPSIFYSGMPRRADPNISLRVVGLAFTSKVQQLQATSAQNYARIIRVVLPLGIVLFCFILFYLSSQSKP